MLVTTSPAPAPAPTHPPPSSDSFVCDSFHQQFNLAPEDVVIGRPLAAIVDPRDAHILQGALLQVLTNCRTSQEGAAVGSNGTMEAASGLLVHLRVVCGGGVARRVGMSIARGSEGLVVVTRFYV